MTFDELLNKFNSLLYSNTSKYISNTNKSTVYNYLHSMYQIANNEWNTGSLFNEDLYPEVVNYRNGIGTGDDATYNAMQAWLMASQLAEYVPTYGSNTNTQTELFKLAYEIGGGQDI